MSPSTTELTQRPARGGSIQESLLPLSSCLTTSQLMRSTLLSTTSTENTDLPLMVRNFSEITNWQRSTSKINLTPIACLGQYIQGSIKIDAALDDEHPEADIHFHSSQGEHEHFHGVDLSILPGPLKRPVFSRFSPLYAAAMQYGIYSKLFKLSITAMLHG